MSLFQQVYCRKYLLCFSAKTTARKRKSVRRNARSVIRKAGQQHSQQRRPFLWGRKNIPFAPFQSPEPLNLLFLAFPEGSCNDLPEAEEPSPSSKSFLHVKITHGRRGYKQLYRKCNRKVSGLFPPSSNRVNKQQVKVQMRIGSFSTGSLYVVFPSEQN